MNKIFADYLNKFLVAYLDDILIYSDTKEQHLKHIELVLQRLREAKLSYAKMSKCEFFQRELKFLGHVVGSDGIKVDPAKTAVVRDWPPPADVSQLRSFLGLANYFRRFIKDYSTIVALLTALNGNDVPFQWWPSVPYRSAV